MTEFLLADLAEWITTESIGLAHGTTVFSGRLPDTEHAAVAILSTGGRTPVDVMDTVDNLPVAERPSVQVLVRNEDYDEAMRTSLACHGAMMRLRGLTFLHTRFIAIYPQQPPFYVGDDSDGDALWSCNYQLEVEAA